MGLDRVGQIFGGIILAGMAVVVVIIALLFLGLAIGFVKKVIE